MKSVPLRILGAGRFFNGSLKTTYARMQHSLPSFFPNLQFQSQSKDQDKKYVSENVEAGISASWSRLLQQCLQGLSEGNAPQICSATKAS